MSARDEYLASGGRCFIDGQWRYLVDKDKADPYIAELKAMLRLAATELTEYERSDLEQSGSDGIPPLTPDEWCAVLQERAHDDWENTPISEEKP